MKKLIVALGILIFSSCSISDDSDYNYAVYNEILPVESAEVPDEFIVNEVYDISLTYINPSSCHYFNDIYYSKDSNIRTVAVVSTVYPDDNCEVTETEYTTSFNFKPTETGSYIFKFWQGENDEGDDDYLVIEVPVNE